MPRYYLVVCMVHLLLFQNCVQKNEQSHSIDQDLPSENHETVNLSGKNHQLKIQGYPGGIIDRCIENRILGQDVDHLIQPFTLKNETRCWQSEFLGKWMLSAVAAYRYNGSEVLLEKIKYAVERLLYTQQKDGYIGNYGSADQLNAWDIWGRKYSMLGLVGYYEISGDEKALIAAARVADHLISQVGPGKTNIVKTGFYRGMASSSVLEPIVKLYIHTGNSKYLDFANYIVRQWETEEGPKLISKALDHVAVHQRFPVPDKWWSWENGQKAYEMMSCYDGLLQLYEVTKNPDHLKAVERTVDNIIQTEINIAGSGSAFECWYNTVEHQTQPTYHTMETCVTITWMKLCNKLLELTGEVKYADQVEKSFYNALMASMKNDGTEIAKYSPLEGNRQAGEEQCGMHINCCNANGPRGFVMIPAYGIKTSEGNIFINYYGVSEARVSLDAKNIVGIAQVTNYPESGNIEMMVRNEKPQEFTLNLRIPAWSETTIITLNGSEIENIQPGAYHSISRKWEDGDQLNIQFDMRGKLHMNHGHQAISRGPIVLARDSRFDDGFVDETMVLQHQETAINLIPAVHKPDDIWMAFTALCKTGTDIEGEGKNAIPIHFTDFASAGNTWDPTTRYRVWLRKTLDVKQMK